MTMPVVKPVTPPMKLNQPTLELPSPIASSIPCTGKGVKTSQRRYPASLTTVAACRMAAVLSNSASKPPLLIDSGIHHFHQLSRHPLGDGGQLPGLGLLLRESRATAGNTTRTKKPSRQHTHC